MLTDHDSSPTRNLPRASGGPPAVLETAKDSGHKDRVKFNILNGTGKFKRLNILRMIVDLGFDSKMIDMT